MLFINTPHSPQGPLCTTGANCNISCSFWNCMFINLILHLCQSACLYLFWALNVTSGGNYKWYHFVFDSRACSTGGSLTIQRGGSCSKYIVMEHYFIIYICIEKERDGGSQPMHIQRGASLCVHIPERWVIVSLSRSHSRSRSRSRSLSLVYT